ncbi:MAG: TonB-dependent receptor [Opitutales bacterium]|nr:TonB-dependent receptor [Opitutales bacterium]
MKTTTLTAALAAGLFAATSLWGTEEETDRVVVLDDFVVREAARSAPESLSPAGWSLNNVMGSARPLTETPRAVTALTPEAMRRLDIRDLEDLPRSAAGAERINYFGLAGAPVLRGTNAGLYFNGMLRAFQRNEMPTSFGSTESLTLVKGPAPAHFAPTLVGGYVDMLPKSPYYERALGSVELSVGRWDAYRAQADYGAPFLWGDRPAAYRVSLTGQRAKSYFDHVRNDFESIYAAVKVQATPRATVFAGGEFYRFRSSEVPGANRPTQAFIDTGAYVIGEPADLTSPRWEGRAARTLLEFPFTLVVNPSLHSLAVPGAVARERIPSELRAHMIDLNDPQNVERLYSLRPAAEVPSFAYGGDPAALDALRAAAAEELAAVDARPQDLFVYTPEYFAAGGAALTDVLPTNRILADPDDFADAENGMFFLNVEGRGAPGWTWINRSFFEGVRTDKRSTYGFAFRSEQILGENQTRLRHELDGTDLTVEGGLSVRLAHAHMAQDFDAEPFSRRDLARGEIAPNTLVSAGADRGPDGTNLWSTFGGASGRSRTLQTALFTQADWKATERLRIDAGVRAERVELRRSLPAFVDSRSSADIERLSGRDTLEFANAALHATYEAIDGIFVYGAAQRGRTLAPGDGGVLFGETSFPTADLGELGVKSDLFDGRLFTSLSVYRWNQSVFSTRDAYARPLRGEGVEFEAFVTPTPAWSLVAHFTAQRVTLRGDRIGFGALPFDEEDWALSGGILNGADRVSLPDNPDQVYAGFPEVTARLFALWEPGTGLGLAGGLSWRDAYWSDIGRTMRIPGVVLGDAQVFYRTERWEVGLLVDNVFNSRNWAGADPVFAAGTLLTPGLPRDWRLRVRVEF